MTTSAPHSEQTRRDLVGRANREGVELFRRWFGELREAADEGRPSAYTFVMGSLGELLRTFDFPVVFPEINSLQTAVKRVAHEYLDLAEDEGYSPDVCGYVKADVAVQRRGGEHPLGRIPPPAVAVLTNACNTYIKWAEIWERMYDSPMFTIDVPGTRNATPGGGADPTYDGDRRYVEEQIRELIPVLEQASGKRFDIDRLRETMGYANTTSLRWKELLELNANRPAVFNALTDGTIYLGISNAMRGTPESAAYFDALAEEMRAKVDLGIGTVTEERYRLGFVGVPCYPIFRRFNELFSDWGGTFVASTYLWFASGGSNLGFQYDLDRPLESLAEGLLVTVRDAMDSMFHLERILPQMIETHQLDGVVYHPIKSCRTVSTGLADSRRWMMEHVDTPSLFIESDMMDRRVVSEAQLRNRVDAFFEGLAARRQRREKE